MPFTKPAVPHHAAVPAVTGPARLTPKHVEIMARVLARVEALGAQRHAGGDAARPAAVGHEVGRPHQAAQGGVVVGPHRLAEVVEALAAGHQPLAPFDRLGLGRRPLGAQHVVEQLTEQLDAPAIGPRTFGLQRGGHSPLVPAQQRQRHDSGLPTPSACLPER